MWCSRFVRLFDYCFCCVVDRGHDLVVCSVVAQVVQFVWGFVGEEVVYFGI